MPFEVMPIQNLYWSVDRPVVTKVIRDLMNVTRISPQTKINFFGMDQAAPQAGSTLGELGVETRWAYDEKVVVEVSEEFNVDNILASSINLKDVRPIFEDNQLGVSIQPVYALTQVKVNFKYRASDHHQAHIWRNMLRGRVSAMLNTVMLHEVEYDYNIHESLLDVIANVWVLRERIDGYGDSFGDYLTSGLTSNVHLLSSQNGETRVWSAREKQGRIQGYFTFEGIADKPEKDGDHDNHMVSAEYSFQYQKPLFLHIQYPMVVHNQLMPEAFLPIERVKAPEEQPLRYSLSGRMLANFESGQRQNQHKGFEGVTVPEYDDFMPGAILNTTVKVITVAVTITEEDRKTLLNLQDLATHALNDQVLEWLGFEEYAFIIKNYQSIVQLNLYEDTYLQSDDKLVIDSSLNVSAVADLDLRKTYHLRLSLVTDQRYLPVSAVTRLRKYPEVALKLCRAIDASLRGYNGSRKDVPGTKLSEEDVQYLTGQKLPIYHQRGLPPQFISELFVSTPVKLK
jgi:hypothetical protein